MPMTVWVACLGLLIAPGPVFAGWHGFLKLNGIAGESTDASHAGWMDVSSVTTENVLHAAGSVGTVGPPPPVPKDLCFTKSLDKASPLLKVDCAAGTVISSGTLDITPDDTSAQALRVKLSNVLITQVSDVIDTNSPRGVSEHLCLQAQALSWMYAQYNPRSGIASSYLVGEWDFVANAGGATTNSPYFLVSGIQHTNGVQLHWLTGAGLNYRVYAVNQLGAPFVPVAFLTSTNRGTMTYNMPLTGNAMFYIVEQVP